MYKPIFLGCCFKNRHTHKQTKTLSKQKLINKNNDIMSYFSDSRTQKTSNAQMSDGSKLFLKKVGTLSSVPSIN